MMESIGLSIFHSISSFNNAGLTILTKERSMEMYAEDPFMLILTTVLGKPVSLAQAQHALPGFHLYGRIPSDWRCCAP